MCVHDEGGVDVGVCSLEKREWDQGMGRNSLKNLASTVEPEESLKTSSGFLSIRRRQEMGTVEI